MLQCWFSIEDRLYADYAMKLVIVDVLVVMFVSSIFVHSVFTETYS